MLQPGSVREDHRAADDIRTKQNGIQEVRTPDGKNVGWTIQQDNR